VTVRPNQLIEEDYENVMIEKSALRLLRWTNGGSATNDKKPQPGITAAGAFSEEPPRRVLATATQFYDTQMLRCEDQKNSTPIFCAPLLWVGNKATRKFKTGH
jgi:hypothetical protein